MPQATPSWKAWGASLYFLLFLCGCAPAHSRAWAKPIFDNVTDQSAATATFRSVSQVHLETVPSPPPLYRTIRKLLTDSEQVMLEPSPSRWIPRRIQVSGRRWLQAPHHMPATANAVAVAFIAAGWFGGAWYIGAEILGLETWQRKLHFVVNASLSFIWIGLVHQTRDYHYSVPLLMLAVTLLKLLSCLVIWRLRDGTFLDLFKIVQTKWRVFSLFAGPAVLYALAGMLRIDAVQRTDPATYNMLANFLLVAFICDQCMCKKLQGVHLVALTLICLGCAAKQHGREWLGMVVYPGTPHQVGFAQVLVLGSFASLVCTCGEGLLMCGHQVPLALQSVALYAVGAMFIALLTVWPQMWAWLGGCDTRSLTKLPRGAILFDREQWSAIFGEPVVLLQVIVMTFAGVNNSLFWRTQSSITREATCAAAIVLCMLLMWLIFGYPIWPPEVAGIMMVLAGVIIFSGHPHLMRSPCDPSKLDKQRTLNL